VDFKTIKDMAKEYLYFKTTIYTKATLSMGQEKASVNMSMPPMAKSMLACGEAARNMARVQKL